MSKEKKRSNQIADPGFGRRYEGRTGRLINKDGSFNIVKTGARFNLADGYQHFTRMSWLSFALWVVVGYFALNGLFAILYLLIGLENISGLENRTGLNALLGAFNFSFQTFTTVGYGALAPRGVATNLVAALEAMTGLISFALATGLIYGRFSKPKAKVRYSKNAIITPYEDKNALMFRLVNERSNVLMNLEATVLLSEEDESTEGYSKNYYNLKLQTRQVQFLPLNWTLVHVIDEDSPLAGKTAEDMDRLASEILIRIKAFDDSFGQEVYSRFSYHYDEVMWGAKFVKAFYLNENGDVIMDVPRIDLCERASLNEITPVKDSDA